MKAPEHNAPPLLELQDLHKSYGSVEVLHGISLTLRSGEILGLIGENGAGKSTIIKCLGGVTEATSGKIFLDGKPYAPRNVASAVAAGLVTIPQEFNLVNDLTVAENIFLGQEPTGRFGLLDRKTMRRKATALLDKLGAGRIDPGTLAGQLSVAAKQMVEVAKALAYDCRILIMDEPTTVLNNDEVATLFQVIRALRENGTAIIFISHKLREIRQLCDTVVALRDGTLVGSAPVSDWDEQEMARRMVGRPAGTLFAAKPSPPPKNSPVVLATQDLAVKGVLHHVSFELHQGEILGFAGLVGAGRTELAETLYGIRQPCSGTITLAGTPVHFHSPRQAQAAGLAYLPEDRQGTGILTEFPLSANITLSSLKAYCHPFISHAEEQRKAQEYITSFAIKTQDADTPLGSLSGGNQQKVSIAKGLDTHPSIFIFDEPTRGIDIQAKAEVYAFIHGLVASGLSCILISSDLEEVLGLCSRIAVMREGTIAGFVEGENLSEENIMYLATGVK